MAVYWGTQEFLLWQLQARIERFKEVSQTD